MSRRNLPDVPRARAALQPHAGNLGRGGVHGRKRHPRPAARTGESGHGAGGRTDGHAGRNRRTGTGRPGLHGARQKRPCGARRRGERPLHRAGRHRAAALFPLRTGIGTARAGRNRRNADRGGHAAQRRARHVPFRRGRTHDGRLFERGDGRNPAGGPPLRRRAPVDAHPRRSGRRGTSAGEGRRGRGARNLCFADHFGPHADALPGTQDGSRTIVAVAHGRRVRPPRGDRGGNRHL